jgi:hypothetical protein
MKEDFFDLTELIRSLQRADGKPDCFRRPSDSCDGLDCVWRHLCVENQNESESPDDSS